MNINDSRIIKVSEWKKISELPANPPIHDKLDEEFSQCGVYQVAMKTDIDKIGDEIIHELITYTGKSDKGIHLRTYGIRQPSGKHGASIYIRENKLNREDIVIRYLYTDSKSLDHQALEKEVHDTSLKMFGKKFAWKQASAGKDGRFTRILDDCKHLTSSELLQLKSDIKDFYFDAIQKEAIEDWNES